MGDARDLLQQYGVSRTVLPYVLALFAVENAHGDAVWNYDWGNVTTDDPTDPWFLLPDNPRMFLAASNHPEGAANLLMRLQSPTHRRLLEAAQRDDVRAFVRGLVEPHPDTGLAYCPDCEFGPTLATYQQLVRELRSKGSGKALSLELLLALGVPLVGVGVAVWRWSR